MIGKEHNQWLQSLRVSAASRKELEFIEKQRAGSIGSLDHGIRKIKTELYNESVRQKEITYLERRLRPSVGENQNPNITSANSSKQKNQQKTRLSTKDAAFMERQRLVYMVDQIKGIPLFDKENQEVEDSIISNTVKENPGQQLKSDK
ncbi:uncharacterized protein [Clytia hemisphaerica]|uniref:uncharacterized protein isoform X2 n=1 Tax=Clytia hemisphaerica TaxID=252671 RepID=UPI0034D74917